METKSAKCTVVAVSDYAEAEKVARTLVSEGVQAIELCGGFGHSGTARVAAAVAGKAYVGDVRFDGHPGMNWQSPDTMFG
jgi:2-keto-3-deoxy-6-phosphogluconate aldolase